MRHARESDVGPAIWTVPAEQLTCSTGTSVSLLSELWTKYYDRRHFVVRTDTTSNDLKTQDKFRVFEAGSRKAPLVFVLFHGGGMNALSWAMVAALLKAEGLVVSFDYRGHGETECPSHNSLDMNSLVEDSIFILTDVLPKNTPIVFIGHSLGGAVAIHVANSKRVKNISAVCALDIVEGTAIAALPAMPGVIRARPAWFRTIDAAIQWALDNKLVLSPESAAISIPGQLSFDSINSVYVWRTDLMASQPHWEGWYRGLSGIFITLPVSKLLMVAGIDRMDDTLTIAQMQGKFRFEILKSAGHCGHEDIPDTVADKLLSWVKGQRIVSMFRLNSKKSIEQL